jgi:macrodomain Ter protein organizer (MatP/YcbG family)
MGKRKRRLKKHLKKAYKHTRKVVDSGVAIWKRLNTKSNRKAIYSASKKASQVSKNLRDIL